MNKSQVKSEIAEAHGFSVKKINLIDVYEEGGEVISVRFEVCGVVYLSDGGYLEILDQ